MTEKKEVALKKETPIANAELDAMLMEDAGAGTEFMNKDDFAIPRISILQSGSDQVKKSSGGYIQGAEEGMFFDNISNEIKDGAEGLLFIPVSYRRAHIEWKPRTAGGGFVADHGVSDAEYKACEVDDKGNHITADGNEIVPTAEYYGLVVDEEKKTTKQVVISLAKSQLKKARRWNTLINQLQIPKPDGKGTMNPAMFYMAYKLTTVPESNDNGSWFGISVAAYKPTTEIGGVELYMAAREFRKAVIGGDVKVANPVEMASDAESDSDPM
jgi:hypothetical protein